MRVMQVAYIMCAMFVGICASSTIVSADSQRYKLRGKNAAVSYNTYDGCVYLDVYVYASEASQKDQPGAPNRTNATYVSYYYQDYCNPAYPSVSGSVSVDNSVAFQGNINSATIKLNGALMAQTSCYYDFVNGYTCSESTVPVTGTLTFSGTGSPERTVYILTNRTQNFTQRYRSTGHLRWADVAGSIQIGETTAAFDGFQGSLISNAQTDLYLTSN